MFFLWLFFVPTGEFTNSAKIIFCGVLKRGKAPFLRSFGFSVNATIAKYFKEL
jgi:hypothetical protein